MCSDRIWHGAGVTEALAVDRSDHEQVDGVGTETFDSKLCGFDVICDRLPAVTHRLTAVQEMKKKKQNKLKRNQYQEEVDEKKKISYILIMKDLLLSFNPIPIKWTQI